MYDLPKPIIPLVAKPGDRQYWFLRTEQGNLFQGFFLTEHVAIGWDKISDISSIETLSREGLKKISQKEYPDSQRAGLIAGAIKTFVCEMKLGDVVVCPDDGSHNFIIGEIISDTYIEETKIAEKMFNGPNTEGYIKRRKVNWLTQSPIPRSSIDPGFWDITNAHNTLTNATVKYSDYINRFIFPLYIDNSARLHSTYKVTQKDGITAESLLRLTQLLVDHHKKDCEVADTPYNPNDLQIKVTLNSPGIIEIIAVSAGAAGATALIFLAFSHFLNGGKFNFTATKEKIDAEIESEGFLEKRMKAKQMDHEQEMEKAKLLAETLQLKIGNDNIRSSLEINKQMPTDNCNQDGIQGEQA